MVENENGASILDILASSGGAAPSAPITEPVTPPNPEGNGGSPTEPVTPTFDESSFLSEVTGGKFKTREEISQILQKVDAIEPEYLQLKDFKEKAYANEFVAGLNELIRNGADQKQIDLYYDLGKLDDMSKLSDYDALMKADLIRDGDKLTAEEIALKIEDKFPKSAEELAERDGLPEEVAERRFKLMEIQRKEEAIKAREFLNQTRKNVFEVKVDPQQQEKAQLAQRQLQQWELSVPSIQKMVGEKQVIAITDDNTGNTTNIEIPIPQEFMNDVAKSIPQYAMELGFAPTPENLNAMKQEVIKSYVASNYQEILKTVYLNTVAATTKEYVEKQGNPAKPTLPEQAAAAAMPKNDLAYIIR